MKFGIDFGTSFSLAAVRYLGDIYTLLPVHVYGIPSLFYHTPDDGPLTGEYAEQAAGLDSQLIREVKMDLKSSHTVNGKTFTSNQIVGYILNEVIQTALDEAGHRMIDEDLEAVVLSVPAKFEHNERDIIRSAAKIPKEEGGPGCKVYGLIKEPVAAALYYFNQTLADHTRILVYDLGGGTCDVAIVEADSSQEAHYNVLAADMERIGGKDWDSALMAYLEQELRKRGVAVEELSEALKQAAIDAKHDFSRKTAGRYLDKVKARVVVGGGTEKIEISRAKFYELTDKYLQATVRMTKKLLADHPEYETTTMICVGGSCNMPQVLDTLQRTFPYMSIHVMEPEYAVAKGAAIYAEQLTEEIHSGGVTEGTISPIRDIAPYSYGILAFRNYDRDPNDEAVYNLIKMDETLPAIKEHTFQTIRDNQTVVRVRVYESEITLDEYDVPNERNPILEVLLELPSGKPKGTPIYTKISLTQDSLMEVVADDRNGHIKVEQINLDF